MSSALGFGSDLDGDGSVLDAIVELLVADPAQCGADGLVLLVRRSLRVRGWLDGLDAAITVQATRLAGDGASADAATVLGGGGRRSRRDAEAAAARGSVCARMPAVAAALAAGTVGSGHVDAIVAASRRLDDVETARLADHADSLVGVAASSTPEQFARECDDLARNLSGDDGLSRHERLRRDRNVRRWVDKHSGMCKTLLSLDPLADATAWTAIGAAVAAARSTNQRDDDRTWDQLHADVVVELLSGRRADRDGNGDRVPEVAVLIDHRTLRDGIHDRSTCETSQGQQLPVATIRRLCCDGNLIPIVLGSDGEVLDVGRSCRLATRAQRRALRAMYRTCAHPDCSVPFDACRIHHVIYWERGGRTDLANMVPLCERHHHLVHEGGWTLQLFPDRTTIWRTPDGAVYYDGITADRVKRTPPPRSPRCRTVTATEVAAELEFALAAVTSRAPP
jgi:hypothetical protein